MQEKTVVPNVLSDCEYQNWGGGGEGGRGDISQNKRDLRSIIISVQQLLTFEPPPPFLLNKPKSKLFVMEISFQ